jgi:hypothetical protein
VSASPVTRPVVSAATAASLALITPISTSVVTGAAGWPMARRICVVPASKTALTARSNGGKR